ncbi:MULTISPECIES: hypothetical protein [unclassified Nostoc]|uniref:hypothetical protein n=1 Tax=unclassified Nostoc TaxID=2593658 RepID=UPI002AD59AFC|nr:MULTISPECIES: hypothetical protein [unclassified Nostoc]MDZ7955940.1 hypothetical protein [Nostoc sp. DedQUE09]MDZ8086043.1 hypothetical protein [Nostoc sp. DedQUE12b]MDZ8091128.1 hypothetical protein [Nostoc sp. DedQUE05]MDZ8133037.1 hypothetical protein [Nostoc sp. DedQUE07]
MKTQSIIVIVTIPTVILGMLGAIWAIFYFRYTQNIQASFELFFYFFCAGLIAGIVSLIIGILFKSILY